MNIGIDMDNVISNFNESLLNEFFIHDKDLKIHRLLDFTSLKKDIADPWYTGNFTVTYQEIELGCQAFLNYLIEKHSL